MKTIWCNGLNCIKCIARIEEQEEKLANEVYYKLIEFDVQNKNGEGGERLKICWNDLHAGQSDIFFLILFLIMMANY